MARIAIALDARSEDRLIGGLLGDGHEVAARPQTAAELGQLVAEGGVEVILVEASRRLLSAALLAACDAAGTRLIALARGEVERRHAASIGLVEVVDADAEWGELRGLLASPVTAPLLAGAERHGEGTVIAIWGPVGSPGRSTLAVNLAAEFAAAGRSVLLADADSHGSSIAALLGIPDEAPGFAAACRLAAQDALDRRELERLARHYDGRGHSFGVLTGIARSNRWPELSAERVERVIAECRRCCDCLVVDTAFNLESDEEISTDLFAPRRNAATLTALRSADAVVAVGLADPIGVSRYLRAHAELLEVVGVPVTVVMNRVRGGAIGLGAAGQLRSTLARFGGIEEVGLIPDDPRSLDAAVLAARTLRDAAPRSSALAAIASLAADLGGNEDAPARARRRRRPT